jgi:hypothetical protein
MVTTLGDEETIEEQDQTGPIILTAGTVIPYATIAVVKVILLINALHRNILRQIKSRIPSQS